MLKGKTALITGASRGIGKAIALEYAAQGAHVALVYASNAQAAKDVVSDCEAKGVQARAYQCDVSNFADCEALVKKVMADFSSLDILVNNAGITADKLIVLMKESDWDSVLDTNLKGSFNMIRHCGPIFMKARAGKIINVSSISGIMGNAGQANYSASKAGLIGLTKSVARELAPRDVCCNALAPGFIETDMTADISADHPFIKEIPLKRLGTAQDVAAAAVFLASDASNYITGEVLRVDGGLAI